VRRTLVVLGVAVAALAVAGDAYAGSPYKLVGRGQIQTDGERYAVLQEEGLNPRIIDDATGQTYELTPPAGGCRVHGVSLGYALWTCNVGFGELAPPLTNIQTGAALPVPGWDTFMRWWRLSNHTDALAGLKSFPTISRFGRHWIETSWACYHCAPAYQYLNWHSGALVAGLPESRVRLADLNDRDLEVPLCAPLRRRVDPEAFASSYVLPYDYQPPWGLPSIDPQDEGSRLVLDRCGRRRPITVSRCPGRRCSSAQLGAGYLTWAEGRNANAFILSSRKRLRLPAVPGAAGGTVSVQHTRRTIYVSGDGSVYARRSPR
jgi:hypothetical protein